MKSSDTKSVITYGSSISFRDELQNSKSFFLIDKNVYRLHNQKIKKIVSGSPFYLITASERSKSFATLKTILQKMNDEQIDRNSTLVAIGGGVTGDVGGFAASIYKRGISVVHIPTTLLSMVDSSIGGKTGINFKGIKNLIGTFHQPKQIIIDIDFLQTLPKVEIESGFGEILKYAFISGKQNQKIFDEGIKLILKKDFSASLPLIKECVRFKTDVVASDEKESGLRKILNLGHTFAHGIESAFDFKIKHGIAVGTGLICVLFLSYEKRYLSRENLSAMLDFTRKISYPKLIENLDERELLIPMKDDKKNVNRRFNFVLISGWGKVLIDCEAKEREVIKAVKNMKNFLFKRGKTVEL